MESNTISNKQVSAESNKVRTFPIIVLVLLILTFVGLQAYYLISSLMNP